MNQEQRCQKSYICELNKVLLDMVEYPYCKRTSCEWLMYKKWVIVSGSYAVKQDDPKFTILAILHQK